MTAVAEPKPMARQLKAVYDLMRTGEKYTLGSLAAMCRLNGVGISETSASARIRELRGRGFTIERTPSEHRGVWLYRLCLEEGA